MDFTAICRTCIKAPTNIGLNPIFFSEDTHEKFSAAFYSCTGVQVKFNDGLPQNMCTACMKQFNNMLKFRKQCKQAETQLLKLKTDLESENFNISTTEEPTIHFTKERLAETDLQNCSKEMSIKSEYKSINIKKESSEIDIDEDQPLKYWVNKNIGNISLLESNNLKVNDATAEDMSEPEYFNEETVLFRDEYSFNTNKTLTQNNESIQCEIYSRRPQKNNHIPESDKESHIAGQTSASSITEEKSIEIPYIITKTDTTKTARVVCKLCQKELSIRSIDSHMMRRHPGADERKVKCDLCDKYVMRDKLNRHRVMMHGNVGVKCGYCKSEFNSKEALLDHVTTCTAKNKKRKINDSGRAIAECDICKMTMQRASLSKHKAVKHAGLRPVCEHCGKSFGNKFRLNEHYRAKHGYEKFKCSYCDFRSAGIMAMRNHERRHRGEKPYVCETCGAKFHAAYLLMQHKHSHNTEKLVKCDLCPASFKANNNLHMHKLTCHSKSYYSCTLCARSYKCRYYAVKHVRVAHSVSEAPEVIKLMTP